MKHILAFFFALSAASAADLTLLDSGKSDYQIVVPDQQETQALTDDLAQTARLLQTAFLANGVDVAVVTENLREAAKPALMLGNTRFAQSHGVDATKLRDWSFVHCVIGRDIVVLGRDHPSKTPTDNKRRPNWNRVGTAKAAADFARQFMGVRFLYPDLAGYTPVSGAARMDLLASPAIEFLPMKTITVPESLNVTTTPLLRVNTAHPAGGSFYDLAHNRFPRVDEMFGGHTWERAIPAENFAQHPEFFALVNGSRLKPESGRGAQFCLSNAEVQERIYRDLASWLDKGYESVDLGQPDGFRECQCEKCEALYGTGKDWSEKIWMFNRHVAERLEKSHPGRQVTMMSYILTAAPPKTFSKFPANTCIMLTGTNEEDIAPWRGIKVPRGFTGYVYDWCPNLGTRYTPMRTPGFIEAQVKRLAANHIQSLYRDGPGQLFGLEGPVYYTMGRMFDDPENLTAGELVPEFCEAAFGKSAAMMKSFYDQLYVAISLYSDHIGTRCDLWRSPTYDGRPVKTVTDPFQLIAFLYTPNLLSSLDGELTQAEKMAMTDKVKARLALVRREFEYVRHFARVVHLSQAWQMVPDAGSRDRLLDAIDARNAFIASLYDNRGNPSGGAGQWSHVMFPFSGHSAEHLRLAYDGYQEPYANTCFNWDTKAMRAAPLPGKKKLIVAEASTPINLDGAEWNGTTAHELTLVPPFNKRPLKSTVRLLYDQTSLYLRADCELDDTAPSTFPKWNRDRVLTKQESFDIYLQPEAAKEVFYRITTGANGNSKYDAVAGLISDVMDPRHGKDDPTWNGNWQSETRVDTKAHRWQALVTIPFKTLSVEVPSHGTIWRANFGRTHALAHERTDRAIWSSTLGSASIDDRGLFGEIVFE